jgi:hypothetical protein
VRAAKVIEGLNKTEASLPKLIRRPEAQKLQGGISLATEIRREKSNAILAFPSDGVVVVDTASVIAKLANDAIEAFPLDAPDELLPAAPKPKRKPRSPAQLQALQRENDRRREAKLAKAIRDREALVSQRGSDGRENLPHERS